MALRIKSAVFGVLGACLALAGCSGEPKVSATSRSAGPDAFAIVPYKPLQEPASYAQLPAPTPGGTNLADQTPKTDALLALGGSGASVAGDPALLTATSRYGVSPAIRAELAAADLRFRRLNDGNVVTRLFARNQYERVYRRYGINPWDEAERLAALGIDVPAVPAR